MLGLCQTPIRGREYNRPEVRCRTFEFKSHHQFPARRILYSHNAALLLLPVFRIDEEHRLPGEHFHFQRKQSPMSVHYQRVRLFLNAFPFRRIGHQQERHMQHYARAAPPVTGLGSVHFCLWYFEPCCVPRDEHSGCADREVSQVTRVFSRGRGRERINKQIT